MSGDGKHKGAGGDDAPPPLVAGPRPTASAGKRRSEGAKPAAVAGGEKAAGARSRRRGGGGGGGLVLTALKWLVIVAIWAFVALAVVVAYYCYDLPDVRQVAQHIRRPAITLIAADGTPFSRTGDLQGAIVDADRLPRHLVNAVLAIEDRRFFHHFGIDPIGLARAIVVNLRHDHAVQGGSTITQQLAKNLFLSPQRALRRKVQEALLALWLEHLYTKNQILTAYLNRVYLGSGAYGVDAAAQTYFGKPVGRITLHEAALIAGLLKAPSHYSPLANPVDAELRARVVLGTMVEAGMITQADAERADAEPPTPPPSTADGIGRYFANWVADHVGSYIGSDHEDLVVTTTLDLTMQQVAERRVAEIVGTQGAPNHFDQGALLALSPDGAVRAMVGGRNYATSPFNRTTQSLRQPGSAFKPLLYLAALNAGFTPDTTIEDAPLRIGGWAPANYEKGFRGAVTLRDALAHSINTSAVRLAQQVGIDRVRTLAQRLGITSPLGRDLSLALGTSEVTMLELVSAYAAIANGGRPVIAHAIEEIRDTSGNVLYQRHGSRTAAVAEPSAVADLTGMMTAVLAYGTGKAARLDRPAAGKTGTTSDYRDAWFVGFTADVVAGVWVGNDNNEEMKKVTGGSWPAKLWHDFMVDVHAGLPARPLPYANGADPTALVVAPAPAPAGTDDGISHLIERLSGTNKVDYDHRNANRRN